MINPFSTPARKDNNLQTVKRRLCGGLRALTKPSNAFDNKTLCSLSDSDCSTLIDYDLDDDLNDYSSDDIEEDSLPFEEQSWTRTSIPEQSRVSQDGVAGFRHYARECSQPRQESLLDEEECSWVMPRSTRNTSVAKPRFALFARRPKISSGRAGIEPQLLDPEERSWM